jgi:hypothetical protein
MTRLEDLQPTVAILGILPEQVVKVLGYSGLASRPKETL